MSCDHNCAVCGGCCKNAGEIELTAPELEILESLGQFAFLPIARKTDDTSPVYLEEEKYTREEYALFLQVLEKKGLISLDFDKPMKNFSSEKYAAYPVIGSMALTERGQKVLEILQMQGIS